METTGPSYTFNVCDPGRAAYETFCACVVASQKDLESTPWDDLPRVVQLAWCEAASTAIERFWSNTQLLREIPKE